jgi:hypothetical protein
VDRFVVVPAVTAGLGIVMRLFGSGNIRAAGYFVFDLGLIFLTVFVAARVWAMSVEPSKHHRVRRLHMIALGCYGVASTLIIARHLGLLPIAPIPHAAIVGLLVIVGSLALLWPWLRPVRDIRGAS